MTGKAQILLFSALLFISACLVFSVQPMLGKMILPYIGGSHAGWAVAMAFFQLTLLAGYAASHFFARFGLKTLATASLAILAIGFLFLPISYDTGVIEALSYHHLTFALFGGLFAAAGAPFFALSMIAPTYQKIFSYSDNDTAQDPYYLYVASNLGSLAGLFGYAFILEPKIGLAEQSYIWMTSYIILFFLALGAVLLTARRSINMPTNTPASDDTLPPNVTWARRLQWLALSAIPSSLMIGVTSIITVDIAPIPFLWVIPLGFYLLTFVVAFGTHIKLTAQQIGFAHLFFVAAILSFFILQQMGHKPLNMVETVLFLTAGFFCIALSLHKKLYSLRPQTNALTEFYLFLSLGGAMGGLFNAFLAPVIFSDYYEFYLVVLLSVLLSAYKAHSITRTIKVLLISTAWIGLFLLYKLNTLQIIDLASMDPTLLLALLSMFVLFILLVLRRYVFVLITTPLMIAIMFGNLQSAEILKERNFYGAKSIQERLWLEKGIPAGLRTLSHGTTSHGTQVLHPDFELQLTTYYAERGPLGDIFAKQDPKFIAVIGLGTGQTACYQSPGRFFKFYELDPAIVRLAHSYFTFLEKCPEHSIVTGDGRLQLAKSADVYDLIILDAFSSDAIPVHLLTTEAIETYSRHLTKGGAIAIHISNRYLDLKPLIKGLAENKGWHALSKSYYPNEEVDPFAETSTWTIISQNRNLIISLQLAQWRKIEENNIVWTDNHSTLLPLLKLWN